MSSIQWPSRSFRALLPNLNAAASRRLRRWAWKRQGIDTHTTRLRPGRVYILPTGVGMVYALMTFAMLLGSMNYNNNLSFVLTFTLIGIGLIAMHQCQRNLVDVELAFAGVEPVFAGQSAQFRIAITNHARSRRCLIGLRTEAVTSEVQDLAPGESRIFVLSVATRQRGYVRLERFSVLTSFPFELFRAWAWLHMDLKGLVYPRPADIAPRPPPARTSHGHRQHDARGEEDFAGLRKFYSGDSPRHVAWKAYARTGQLLSKQFAGADISSQWFDFDALTGHDVETRLSILTRWINDADRTFEDYGLKLPGQSFPPAHGDKHRRRCLEALALFGPEDADG